MTLLRWSETLSPRTIPNDHSARALIWGMSFDSKHHSPEGQRAEQPDTSRECSNGVCRNSCDRAFAQVRGSIDLDKLTEWKVLPRGKVVVTPRILSPLACRCQSPVHRSQSTGAVNPLLDPLEQSPDLSGQSPEQSRECCCACIYTKKASHTLDVNCLLTFGRFHPPSQRYHSTSCNTLVPLFLPVHLQHLPEYGQRT
jgi:hypothetical protein